MPWYGFLNRHRAAIVAPKRIASETPADFPGPLVLPRMQTLVTTNAKGEVKSMRVTKEQLTRIFNEVESDPTAGMGIYTKREIAADAVMRLINTAEPTEGKPPGSAAPLFNEPAAKKEGAGNGGKPGDKTG